MQELILLLILISTSKVSRTRRVGGRWNSACSGRKTLIFTGAEKRNPPLVETVNAQRDHLPASDGPLIVRPEDAISAL